LQIDATKWPPFETVKVVQKINVKTWNQDSRNSISWQREQSDMRWQSWSHFGTCVLYRWRQCARAGGCVLNRWWQY